MLSYYTKKIIPEKIKSLYRKKVISKSKILTNNLKKLDEQHFQNIIENILGIQKNDTVFIHSSLDKLNLDFPIFKALSLILEIIGKNGTVLFPTYPKRNSYEFVKSGEIFNIRKSPSYTGLLSELARRHPQAKRSLHPTKSVVAIGNDAEFYIKDHHQSTYPYDKESPYRKALESNAKIIGIGVDSTYLSCVHVIDDFFKERFPVNPYHKKPFTVPCIDMENNKINVTTFVHHMGKMDFHLPSFFKKHLPNNIFRDIDIDGMKFFIANGLPFFDRMLNLAKNNITIYPRYHYKLSKFFK